MKWGTSAIARRQSAVSQLAIPSVGATVAEPDLQGRRSFAEPFLFTGCR
jgi:hypothetical protein